MEEEKRPTYWKIVAGRLIIVAVFVAGTIALLHSLDRSNVDIVQNGAASVVPSQEELVRNLMDAGYDVLQFDEIYELEVTGKRVFGKEGSSRIDICYQLNQEDASTTFQFFKEKYLNDPNCDYYIIAQNETFVYYISDKAAFQNSGFKSTDNIGEQYIRE